MNSPLYIFTYIWKIISPRCFTTNPPKLAREELKTRNRRPAPPLRLQIITPLQRSENGLMNWASYIDIYLNQRLSPGDFSQAPKKPAGPDNKNTLTKHAKYSTRRLPAFISLQWHITACREKRMEWLIDLLDMFTSIKKGLRVNPKLWRNTLNTAPGDVRLSSAYNGKSQPAEVRECIDELSCYKDLHILYIFSLEKSMI